MENVKITTPEEEKLTWSGIWMTLKIGFFLAIGFNIGDLLWLIVSRIVALI